MKINYHMVDESLIPVLFVFVWRYWVREMDDWWKNKQNDNTASQHVAGKLGCRWINSAKDTPSFTIFCEAGR